MKPFISQRPFDATETIVKCSNPNPCRATLKLEAKLIFLQIVQIGLAPKAWVDTGVAYLPIVSSENGGAVLYVPKIEGPN